MICKEIELIKREEVLSFCQTLNEVYLDKPFKDPNYIAIRHNKNKKIFILVFERDDKIWLNVKCNTEWRDFFRSTYKSVVPAYHMNKEHWNSIILDGEVPKKEIIRMIEESYDLTK